MSALRAKRLHKSAVTIYAGIFLLVITVVAIGYGGDGATPELGVVSATQSAPKASTSNQPGGKISVDQLTAANAVTSLAETANLPVAGDLREATTTLYIKKQLAQTNAEVISKPQIVQPTADTERGVANYVVEEGDTIDTIAAKFRVSAQTIKWANDIASNSVEVGRTIVVPRVDGVLYTVKEGDTYESLSEKYGTDTEQIILYNDLNADESLEVGTKIILPNGDLPENERPGYVAPRQVAPSYTANVGFRSSYSNMGGSIISRSYGYNGPSSGNRYAAGNCTWYVYERRAEMGRPIGGLWGNARSWASSAASAGYVVNGTPAVGAIIQTAAGGGGYGHVGIVERIEADHIVISDMNYAGYNVVTWRTISMSQASSFSYIH